MNRSLLGGIPKCQKILNQLCVQINPWDNKQPWEDPAISCVLQGHQVQLEWATSSSAVEALVPTPATWDLCRRLLLSGHTGPCTMASKHSGSALFFFFERNDYSQDCEFFVLATKLTQHCFADKGSKLNSEGNDLLGVAWISDAMKSQFPNHIGFYCKIDDAIDATSLLIQGWHMLLITDQTVVSNLL